MRRTVWGLGLGLGLGLALLVASCSDQPGDDDIKGAVERLQQAWAQQQRQQRQTQNPPGPFRLPDLSLEAALDLRITALRRLSCSEAPEVSGWLCTFELTATNAGNPPVTRVMQGQFTHGGMGWVARNVEPAPPSSR